MKLEQPAHHREPEAGAGRLAGCRGALEGAADAIEAVQRDADAGVGHRQPQRHLVAVARAQLGAEHDHAAVGELQRVAEQVDEHLLDAQRVAAQARRQRRVDRGIDADRLVLAQRRGQAQHARGERRQVQRQVGLDLQPAGFEARQVEQVVDDAQHQLRRLLDVLEVVALGGGRLLGARQAGEADDGMERRAQLVADAGDELVARTQAGGRLRRRQRKHQALPAVWAGAAAHQQRQPGGVHGHGDGCAGVVERGPERDPIRRCQCLEPACQRQGAGREPEQRGGDGVETDAAGGDAPRAAGGRSERGGGVGCRA